MNSHEELVSGMILPAFTSGHYSERIWLSRWVSGAFVILILALTIVEVAQTEGGIILGNGRAPDWLIVTLDATFVLLLLNFSSLKVEINQNRIRISYGIFRKSIPLKEVVSCRPTGAGFWLYGGMGIRIGADDSLAFTTSMGKAVLLVRADGRDFVFSTKRPTEVVAVITALIAK